MTMTLEVPMTEDIEAKAKEMYEAYRTPEHHMYPWDEQPYEPTKQHWRYKAVIALSQPQPVTYGDRVTSEMIEQLNASVDLLNRVEDNQSARRQPQPVAQGEAVYRFTPLQLRNMALQYDNHQKLVSEMLRQAARDSETLGATPTIPTGHRVVPVEPTDEMVDILTSKLFENFMAYQHALMNPHTSKPFWKKVIAAALAASPSAGGV